MKTCLVNLPRFEIHRPPLSLGILGEICNQNQVDWECLDLALEIWKELPHHFHDVDSFCITSIIDDDILRKLKRLIAWKIQDVVDREPGIVFCLSLISHWSIPVCELTCKIIKEISNCKIIIGGNGLEEQDWVTKMKQSGLIDHFVYGEGELAFAAFLRGEKDFPGLDNFDFQQVDNLDDVFVIPDYRRLPLEEYNYIDHGKALFITASRGCVRSCSYCDVGYFWKKFRYRSAEKLAEEMITQFERHGVVNFYFTDSLINGSMKMLDELCEKLIEYKEKRPDAQFNWKGQYIFRPIGQVKERHIANLKAAGCTYLIVGLETGSDKVRYDMNKKHTTDDAEWYLEMFQKYGIQCHLLMLTGYVTETLQDHQDTLNLFKRWKKFVASKTIAGIELGNTLSILPNSPVGKLKDKYGIKLVGDKMYFWTSDSNPELTVPERYRRRLETQYVAIKENWPVTRGHYRLEFLRNNILELIDILKKQQENQSIDSDYTWHRKYRYKTIPIKVESLQDNLS